MTCPNCGADHSMVVKRTAANGTLQRVRQCPVCRFQWYTVEVVAEAAERQEFQAYLFQTLVQEHESCQPSPST